MCERLRCVQYVGVWARGDSRWNECLVMNSLLMDCLLVSIDNV